MLLLLCFDATEQKKHKVQKAQHNTIFGMLAILGKLDIT